MPRNLDLTALRSFVAVADTGGVTRAAGFLNLTQSAVSMQLKRLEESLGLGLLDRTGRRVALTPAGEQLLSYARRMLALNDEVMARMTDPGHEGEIVLGVPHDIVYPAIPVVLRQFHARHPRMRVNLWSSNTRELKEMFARGDAPVILTTESGCDDGGETLAERALLWVGAREGRAWTERPLRLAFEQKCIFRAKAQAALDAAGIDWVMAVDSNSSRTVEASVSADLAVHAVLDGTCPSHAVPVDHGGKLPDLGTQKINLYGIGTDRLGPIDTLMELIREGFRAASGRDHHLSGRATAAE